MAARHSQLVWLLVVLYCLRIKNLEIYQRVAHAMTALNLLLPT
jgi:hypothetical protein